MYIKKELRVRHLGLCEYLPVLQAMQHYTNARQEHDPDELWLLQHPPVFTQGQAGKAEHILDAGDIPIIHTDRGGQVTYHGPGQLLAYCLFNLQALGLGIRCLVHNIENSILAFLTEQGVEGHRRENAPGVYVQNKKICSIGLRVRRGFTYHGFAFNVDMDLSPFKRINPCGYTDLAATQLSDWTHTLSFDQVAEEIISHLCKEFGYNGPLFVK